MFALELEMWDNNTRGEESGVKEKKWEESGIFF